ncbi:hypothetical protein LCGC14_0163540 [marine sediment metagenome]|uniref:Uncharacterized protein n=1 Tax=marine sediment metagenome TaxID=412755 RepID=A0A0F9UUE5_9ZZZZ
MTRRRADLIRKRARQGWSRARIAKTYSVDKSCVGNILRGKTWAWDTARECNACEGPFYAENYNQQYCDDACKDVVKKRSYRALYPQIGEAASKYAIRKARAIENDVRARTIPRGRSRRGSRGLFSDAEVMEVRDRWADGQTSYSLAEEFDVCSASVYAVAVGKTYKHLPLIPLRAISIVCAHCEKTFKARRPPKGGKLPLFCPSSTQRRGCGQKAMRVRLRKAALDVAYDGMQADAANFLIGNKPVTPSKKQRTRRGRVAPRCAKCNRFYVRFGRPRKYIKYCTGECVAAGHAQVRAVAGVRRSRELKKERKESQVGTVCKQCGKSPLPPSRWVYCSTKCLEKFVEAKQKERYRLQALLREPKPDWFDDDDLIRDIRERYAAGQTQQKVVAEVSVGIVRVSQAAFGTVRPDLPLAYRACCVCKADLPLNWRSRYCVGACAAKVAREVQLRCNPIRSVLLSEIAPLIRGMAASVVAEVTGMKRYTIYEYLYDLDKPGRRVRQHWADQITQAAEALKEARTRVVKRPKVNRPRQPRARKGSALVSGIARAQVSVEKDLFKRMLMQVCLRHWEDLPVFVDTHVMRSLCAGYSVKELSRGARIAECTAKKIIEAISGKVRDTTYLRVLAFSKAVERLNAAG